MAKLYVALDFDSKERALEVADKCRGLVHGYKVGLELFCTEGPDIVKELSKRGDVFLDLKFHDIPNTMKKALKAVLKLPVSIVNIHAMAGESAMKEIANSIKNIRPDCKIIAVTMLTSFDKDEMNNLNIEKDTVRDQVLYLAETTKRCGLDGVVCSPEEVNDIKKVCGSDFLTVVPGIRPGGTEKGDQKRVATPCEAVKNGADILICGRPIYNAPDIEKAVNDILKEMEEKYAG